MLTATCMTEREALAAKIDAGINTFAEWDRYNELAKAHLHELFFGTDEGCRGEEVRAMFANAVAETDACLARDVRWAPFDADLFAVGFAHFSKSRS